MFRASKRMCGVKTVKTMWNWLGKVSMEIGDLFRYKKKKGFIDWNEIEGHIGVILSGPNRHGQYKTLIKNKTLYILRTNMEKL
jgi:hypothetical protein